MCLSLIFSLFFLPPLPYTLLICYFCMFSFLSTFLPFILAPLALPFILLSVEDLFKTAQSDRILVRGQNCLLCFSLPCNFNYSKSLTSLCVCWGLTKKKTCHLIRQTYAFTLSIHRRCKAEMCDFTHILALKCQQRWKELAPDWPHCLISLRSLLSFQSKIV